MKAVEFEKAQIDQRVGLFEEYSVCCNFPPSPQKTKECLLGLQA